MSDGRNVSARWPGVSLGLAGSASVLFGLVMAVAWVARRAGILEAARDAAPVRLDGSLGFVFLGCGCLALSLRRPRWAFLGAVAVCVVALVAGFVEIVAGTAPPLDGVLPGRRSPAKAFDPGGVLPNAAFFILCAVSLLFLAGPRRVNHRLVASAVSSSVVVGLASVALVGYAINVESTSRWGAFRPATLAASAVFFVAGAALFTYASTCSRSRRSPLPRWLPLTIASGGVTTAVSLWHTLTVIRNDLGNWFRTFLLRERNFAEEYLAELALVAGAAIALLLALAVYLGQKAALRASERAQALRALRTAHDELERRVEARTAEIASVNEELQQEIRSREKLEAILRQRADLLADADRRKDEFLAMLGHELRNPLAALSLGLDTLEVESLESAIFAKTRIVMKQRLRHVVRLVDDLLDVSRVTSGKIRLRKRRVELDAIVSRALESLRPLARQHGHLLSVSLPQDPLHLDADDVRLEQIFSNLLSNAIKYTARNGRIDVMAERQGAEAVVRVRDTGIGISSEFLPRIFDSFAQATPPLDRSGGGLGVGLTLARRLAALHGGTIEAFSGGIGHGSEFVVRLPLAAGAMETKVESASGNDPRSASVSRRVLIVEDSADLLEMFQRLLTIWGHQVIVARDGCQALEVACGAAPEAALIDIGLPGMNGYDLAVRLREKLRERILLIALTGYAQPRHRRRAREAGFDHHLVKPVDLQELKGILGAASA